MSDNYAMKPIIAVSPLYDAQKDSIWMLPGYTRALELAGAAPLILPLTDDTDLLRNILSCCDGLLLTGGHDVEPSLYNAEKSEKCGETCPLRDREDLFLLDYAIRRNMPVLGICRGIQLMNAALGGTLYQHLPDEFPTKTEHCMSRPYDREQHKVNILPDTPLYKLFKRKTLGVNSYHHQAVKELSPKLRAMAVSEDGLVEGVFMPERKFC